MLSRTMARDLNCVAIHGDKSQVRVRIRVRCRGSVSFCCPLLPWHSSVWPCLSRRRCISILRRTALARVGAPIAELSAHRRLDPTDALAQKLLPSPL